MNAHRHSVRDAQTKEEKKEKEKRHQDREERRKQMEYVLKTYWDQWEQPRDDDF